MAKFKKQFWSGDKPEPSWYAEQKDPTSKYRFSSGDNPEKSIRPKGKTIPTANVGGVVVSIREAYKIFKAAHIMFLSYEHFKTALLNGSTFETGEGLISKA